PERWTGTFARRDRTARRCERSGGCLLPAGGVLVMRKMYRTLRMSAFALRRNIMRSALTTLGIVIGVAAVIAMMEIGKGSSKAVEQTIASMGANNLLVQPGTASSGGVSFGSGSI